MGWAALLRKDVGIQYSESRGCCGRNKNAKVMTNDELEEK